jgi:hypothetical protein
VGKGRETKVTRDYGGLIRNMALKMSEINDGMRKHFKPDGSPIDIQDEAYTEVCLENERLKAFIGRAARVLEEEHLRQQVIKRFSPAECRICALIVELRKAAQ